LFSLTLTFHASVYRKESDQKRKKGGGGKGKRQSSGRKKREGKERKGGGVSSMPSFYNLVYSSAFRTQSHLAGIPGIPSSGTGVGARRKREKKKLSHKKKRREKRGNRGLQRPGQR